MTDLETWKREALAEIRHLNERLDSLYMEHETLKLCLAQSDEDNARLRENAVKWIPVSERLPENNVWVNGTMEHYGKRTTAPVFYSNGSWCSEFPVIAWSELPAPYERE